MEKKIIIKKKILKVLILDIFYNIFIHSADCIFTDKSSLVISYACSSFTSITYCENNRKFNIYASHQ